jgi:hypothetical protein
MVGLGVVGKFVEVLAVDVAQRPKITKQDVGHLMQQRHRDRVGTVVDGPGESMPGVDLETDVAEALQLLDGLQAAV